jgi:hypothetical protein
MGIRRSAENPNLCSRCGHHLAAGEIHPVCLLQFELSSSLSFGTVDLGPLSARELPALRDQLRSRLEQCSGLVLPHAQDRPLLISAYFNAPVRVDEPERLAYRALVHGTDWLAGEIRSLGIQCRWRAALTSGYVELIACDGPLQCVPLGEVSYRALEFVEQAKMGQVLTDRLFLAHLATQDPSLVSQDLLAQLQHSPVDAAAPLLLMDRSVQGAADLSRRGEPWTTQEASRLAQLGALVLAAIAAPCAAMVVLAPGAAFLGLGAVVASLMPLWKFIGMSYWPRILLTVASVLIAVVNLVRVELLKRRFDHLQRQVGSQLQLPRLQRRRMRLIRWTSYLVLAVIALEGVLRVVVMKMPLL